MANVDVGTQNFEQALRFNPAIPIHREVGTDAYWVFRPDYPARLTGTYVNFLMQTMQLEASLTQVTKMAEEQDLAPFAVQALAMRWLSDGYLISADSEFPTEGRTHDFVAEATHYVDRESGTVLEIQPISSELPVVVVEDFVDIGSIANKMSGPALIVCVRGQSVVVAAVECFQCLATRHGERRALEIVAAELCALAYLPLRPVAPMDMSRYAADLLRRARSSDVRDLLYESLPGGDAIVEHRLMRVPGCPSCDPRGISLTKAGKSSDGDDLILGGDGYRSSTPEQTWERYRHHVSHLVGAVPSVEPKGRPELNVYEAGANLARVGQSLSEVLNGLRGTSGGKGTTADASRAGALAEALERSSSVYRGDEPYILAAFEELPNAVHPNSVHLYSDTQLARMDALWASGDLGLAPDLCEFVPRSFDTHAPVHWTDFTVLGTEETRLLPASVTWIGHPDSRGYRYSACSNGLAAGNSLNEAVLQSLLELVERDSVGLWWYPRCHRPGIDLDAIDDPRVTTARKMVELPGHVTWVLDLTSDFGVPVCVALSAREDGSGILFGTGSHLDPILAITRALTEMAQMVKGWEEISEHLRNEQRWFDSVTLQTDPWLAPTHLVPVQSSPTYASIGSALESLVARLDSAGLEVLVKDFTRRDIGLPVVRTFVPGLRHFWNRRAPGRLYDVPPRLGWRNGPYEESDLNPWTVFI
jgi:bacteriocin biosynthesis cyclodehydratase domain-containing protein